MTDFVFTGKQLKEYGWDGNLATLEDFKKKLIAALELGWDPNEMSLQTFCIRFAALIGRTLRGDETSPDDLKVPLACETSNNNTQTSEDEDDDGDEDTDYMRLITYTREAVTERGNLKKRQRRQLFILFTCLCFGLSLVPLIPLSFVLLGVDSWGNDQSLFVGALAGSIFLLPPAIVFLILALNDKRDPLMVGCEWFQRRLERNINRVNENNKEKAAKKSARLHRKVQYRFYKNNLFKAKELYASLMKFSEVEYYDYHFYASKSDIVVGGKLKTKPSNRTSEEDDFEEYMFDDEMEDE